MTEPSAAPRAAPTPTLGDHLRVLYVFVLSVLGVVPFLLWLPLSPILRPWMRARVRRRLSGPAVAPVEAPSVDPAIGSGRTVFVVAGELSGDRLAASVVRQMRAVCPGLVVRGYGGPACAEAGAVLDRDLTKNAVVGFFAVVHSLTFWWRLCAETLARFRAEPPDLLLTVDFPGLNVRLAGWARRLGIRTVHLVAPQTWGHTPWRIFRWRAGVELLLAGFPFEPPLFERSGIPTAYVGHPLFETPLPPPRGAATWPGSGPCVVELWPGSRPWELKRSVPVLLEAAADVVARIPAARFVVRLADPEHEALFEAQRPRARREPARIEIVSSPPALREPLLGAICVSGTATAQLGSQIVPLAVFYKIGFADWCLMKVFVTAPWICLVNLILGRDAVPERVPFTRNAGRLVAQDFLGFAADASRWAKLRADLEEVRARLEVPDVADRVARVVLDRLRP